MNEDRIPSMNTNLSGRLRNTSLLLTHALMPLYEAVVNAIHALEEAQKENSQGFITVQVIRTPQVGLHLGDREKKRASEPEQDITGFKIIDNGIGFNDANLNAFQTLDTDHKASQGCRGIGRLLWLKAFERISIDSTFQSETGVYKNRKFSFDKKLGVSSIVTTDIESTDTKTTIFLETVNSRYQRAIKKTTEVIAKGILEHCIWYFIRPSGIPHIVIEDEEKTIALDTIYESYMNGQARVESFEIRGKQFDLIHIQVKSTSTNNHTIAYCAANRVVKTENINGKIPGLFGRISSVKGDFFHACYVSSPYLDEKVRCERTDFDMDLSEIDAFEQCEVSFDEIRKAVLNSIENKLKDYLENNIAQGMEHLQRFVDTKAPKYKSILSRIPEDQKNIDPKMNEKDLDLYLHKQLAHIESQVLDEGHSIMKVNEGENPDEYQKRIQDYLNKAEDIKKSDLASYVSHRKVILELLKKAIERLPDGKYVREDLIHRLIMPMGVDSTQISQDACNLWLIDERLAFHNYLASDTTLNAMPITGSIETKEPDILVLNNVFDNPILTAEGNKVSLSSIVVIEIKRPMRNDMREGEDKDPISQAIGYLEKIRQGKVTTAQGRPIPASDSIPGFCYVLADITDTMISRTKPFDLKKTSDGLGYFGYNQTYNAYIEVISFDRLITMAEERNRAFFDKLGLPTL